MLVGIVNIGTGLKSDYEFLICVVYNAFGNVWNINLNTLLQISMYEVLYCNTENFNLSSYFPRCKNKNQILIVFYYGIRLNSS